MSDILSPDAALAAEIERLKVAFPRTRELYREVCALLFFRFGVTPTANRLYQLVRRGSMGTPTAVLAEFWTALREKSRVRLERPDLPVDLQDAAGDLVAALWDKASAAAHDVLGTVRLELQAEQEAARTEMALAHDATARADAALEARNTMLAAAQARIQELEQALAVGDASRRTLEGDIARLQRENRDRDAALVQARADFTRELEKLRGDAQRAEARLHASEQRALLEIERERALATRVQKDLDAAVRRTGQHDERHRADRETLQAQLGDARHQAGLLQGRLAAVEATSAAYVRELGDLRRQLSAVPARNPATKGHGPTRGRIGAARPATPVRKVRQSKGPAE